MSERGSFVTEVIQCEKCLKSAKTILCDPDIFGRGGEIHVEFDDDGLCDMPIVAGFVKGSYEGEELHYFEGLIPQLEAAICHTLRVAVIAESGERIFTVHPFIAGPENDKSQTAKKITGTGFSLPLRPQRHDALCKFKIGELVWCMRHDKARQSVVARISIGDRPSPEYWLHHRLSLNSCDGRDLTGGYSDDTLYRTKEELIASL